MSCAYNIFTPCSSSLLKVKTKTVMRRVSQILGSRLELLAPNCTHSSVPCFLHQQQPPSTQILLLVRHLSTDSDSDDFTTFPPSLHHPWQSEPQPPSDSCTSQNDDSVAVKVVQDVLRTFPNNSSDVELGRAFQGRGISSLSLLSDEVVAEVLRRQQSDWKLAFRFFNWVCRKGMNFSGGYDPGHDVYDQMLDILGKMKRFDEVNQLLDEMFQRKGYVRESTYGILVHRYAAAHKIEEATDTFYKRREHGLELDSIAFNTLLLSLCRYKHVEEAEFLFHSKKDEFSFHYDIKTWNIILNGWCVLGNLRESKRFWKEIIRSNVKPDKFTYGIFLNSLCKSGKTTSALKLFQKLWEEEGCNPDVTICNTVIDGLCFKKRIPEAFKIFNDMKERGGCCSPNTVTYNSFIKYLCKIQRMKKVYELVDEMEEKKGTSLPNSRTYIYLLKSVKEHGEVPGILERMERHGCKVDGDVYNLLLRLYSNWGWEDKVHFTWAHMEKDGQGPDHRSYTVIIHWLFCQQRMEEAMRYFEVMTSKGMIPEPRTKLLVDKYAKTCLL